MSTLKKKLDLFQFTQEGTLFLTIRCGEIGYAKGPTDSDGMPREPIVCFYEHKYVLEELKRELDATLLAELSSLLDREERWWHQLAPCIQQWLLSPDVTWGNGKATAAWFGPRPECCVDATVVMEDALSQKQPFVYLRQRYDRDAPSACSGPMLWWCGSRAISHCPFCGTPLPSLEKDPNPVGPIHHTTDGNYCDTCKERNHGCVCRPPSANYRLKRKKGN